MKRPQRRFADPLTDAEKLRLATNPGVWFHVRVLLDDRRVERPRECQIALRSSRPEGTPRTLDTPHLDGYSTPYDGLPDDIRYMCFFRLSVRGLASHRTESMLDIWRDWPALRNFNEPGSD